MVNVTFEFRNRKHWQLIWEVLNIANYRFASYGYKLITVWGEESINMVREACKVCDIKVKEI